jgi:hypothetical protein
MEYFIPVPIGRKLLHLFAGIGARLLPFVLFQARNAYVPWYHKYHVITTLQDIAQLD